MNTRDQSQQYELIERSALVWVAVAMVGFAVVGAQVWHRSKAVSLDRVLLHGYVPHTETLAFRVANVVTLVASPGFVVLLGVMAALFVWHSSHSMVLTAASIAAPGIAGVTESTLKFFFARSRPLTAMLTDEAGNGFPSGHATGFATLALTVALIGSHLTGRRRASSVLCAVIASSAVALTRVLVGAPYPSDVVAGLLLGLSIAVGVCLVASNVSDEFVVQKLMKVLPARLVNRF